MFIQTFKLASYCTFLILSHTRKNFDNTCHTLNHLNSVILFKRQFKFKSHLLFDFSSTLKPNPTTTNIRYFRLIPFVVHIDKFFFEISTYCLITEFISVNQITKCLFFFTYNSILKIQKTIKAKKLPSLKFCQAGNHSHFKDMYFHFHISPYHFSTTSIHSLGCKKA